MWRFLVVSATCRSASAAWQRFANRFTQCSYTVILEAGMDVGIVNVSELLSIDELDPELREASENVVLNKMENATEVM